MMVVMIDFKPRTLGVDGETGMKVTKAKAAENRTAIVAAASRLFRERGFDGVGVAEIMQAAGLTHGGFYGNFASKDALAAEACACSFAQSGTRATPGSGATGGDLAAYLDTYLSERHRDRPANGCPVAAYVTEVARQDDAVQAEFTAGVARLVDCIAERLAAGEHGVEDAEERRSRALTVLAAMAGGMALARATALSNRELSAEILAAVRAQVGRLAGPD